MSRFKLDNSDFRMEMPSSIASLLNDVNHLEKSGCISLQRIGNIVPGMDMNTVVSVRSIKLERKVITPVPISLGDSVIPIEDLKVPDPVLLLNPSRNKFSDIKIRGRSYFIQENIKKVDDIHFEGVELHDVCSPANIIKTLGTFPVVIGDVVCDDQLKRQSDIYANVQVVSDVIHCSYKESKGKEGYGYSAVNNGIVVIPKTDCDTFSPCEVVELGRKLHPDRDRIFASNSIPVYGDANIMSPKEIYDRSLYSFICNDIQTVEDDHFICVDDMLKFGDNFNEIKERFGQIYGVTRCRIPNSIETIDLRKIDSYDCDLKTKLLVNLKKIHCCFKDKTARCIPVWRFPDEIIREFFLLIDLFYGESRCNIDLFDFLAKFGAYSPIICEWIDEAGFHYCFGGFKNYGSSNCADCYKSNGFGVRVFISDVLWNILLCSKSNRVLSTKFRLLVPNWISDLEILNFFFEGVHLDYSTFEWIGFDFLFSFAAENGDFLPGWRKKIHGGPNVVGFLVRNVMVAAEKRLINRLLSTRFDEEKFSKYDCVTALKLYSGLSSSKWYQIADHFKKLILYNILSKYCDLPFSRFDERYVRILWNEFASVVNWKGLITVQFTDVT